MQSPPVEWSLALGYLVTLDVLRAHGEADDDTLSEVVRGWVARTPLGRTLWAVAVAGGAVALHQHIDRPLRPTKEH